MAAFYITLTTTRPTMPDPEALNAAVRTATGDATAILVFDPLGTGAWRGKKATAWTAPQITAAQNALDTTVADTPQRAAQREIDKMPIATKALLLTLLDQINQLRTQPTTTFASVTPAQALQAVRDKAGTL